MAAAAVVFVCVCVFKGNHDYDDWCLNNDCLVHFISWFSLRLLLFVVFAFKGCISR